MKKIFLVALLCWPVITRAAGLGIIINEICWMGTTASANDEWIELFNTTDHDISLAGWRLESTSHGPSISLSGTSTAYSYFLLERTSDNTVPGVAADQIYKGSLSNDGEWLKLDDADGMVVDQINAAHGWPGGDNKTKKTLERTNTGDWQTSSIAGGTPKAKNSAPPVTSGATTHQAPAAISAPAKIKISEFLPNPPGKDRDGEFIELYNADTITVDLAGWQLDDGPGGSKPYHFNGHVTMPPGAYHAFFASETKLSLGNTHDGVRLFAPGGTLVDHADYTDTTEGASYALAADGSWQQTITPTPNEVNVLNQSTDDASAATATPSSSPTIQGAAIEDLPPQNTARYWWTIGAVISAIAIAVGLKMKTGSKTVDKK